MLLEVKVPVLNVKLLRFNVPEVKVVNAFTVVNVIFEFNVSVAAVVNESPPITMPAVPRLSAAEELTDEDKLNLMLLEKFTDVAPAKLSDLPLT